MEAVSGWVGPPRPPPFFPACPAHFARLLCQLLHAGCKVTGWTAASPCSCLPRAVTRRAQPNVRCPPALITFLLASCCHSTPPLVRPSRGQALPQHFNATGRLRRCRYCCRRCMPPACHCAGCSRCAVREAQAVIKQLLPRLHLMAAAGRRSRGGRLVRFAQAGKARAAHGSKQHIGDVEVPAAEAAHLSPKQLCRPCSRTTLHSH